MRTFLLIVILFTSTMTYAKWDKDAIKAFKGSEAVNLQIDFSEATIMGLDSADCVTYCCNKFGEGPQFLELLFKRFRNVVVTNTSSKHKKIAIGADSDYIFKIKIKNITDNAGLSGEASLYNKENPDNPIRYVINMEDGRWNTFENLFLEAGEEMGKNIKSLLTDYFTYSRKSFKIRK
jgi:hypothetical protein